MKKKQKQPFLETPGLGMEMQARPLETRGRKQNIIKAQGEFNKILTKNSLTLPLTKP